MIATLQVFLYLLFYVAIFGLSVWALIDLLTRPATAFTQAGKRTKAIWGTILGIAVAIAFMAIPAPYGLNFLPFLALLSAVAAIVYLVDVRPAIAPYSRRRPGGGSGPSTPSGGW